MNYRRPHPAADPDFDARNAEVEPDSRLQDGFIKMLLVLPNCMPDARDRDLIERKTELIQNPNLKAKLYMPESEKDSAFVSLGATSKLFMQQGITTAVEYFGRSHESLAMLEGPLLLVQIPAIGRENFLVREHPLKVDDHRRLEITALPPQQSEVWRYCLDSTTRASPEIFTPASHRIDSLEDVPLETTVVVFTPSLRFDMKLQGFAGRENSSKANMGLVRPSIFKRELRNREKYIVSANPGGAFDWDLEVLIRESQDNLDDRLRQLDRFMKVKTEPDGTYRPFFEDKLVQKAIGVTVISTKSARIYEMGLYQVELAVYIDWDPYTGKRLWQSCAMSLYSVDWNEVLERRNLALGPRDFGVCNSALLSVGPDDKLEDGAAILLETVEKLQKFLMDLVCESNVGMDIEQTTQAEPHDVEVATENEVLADTVTQHVQNVNIKASKSLKLINTKPETNAETKAKRPQPKKKSYRR
ncbi:hypothetical protein MGG_06344 [Pyricularia oryzae 70-15]|uniref:Uncharacterized protein n=1 Tax=Pyricularia oryzae (strain 70-15 / ATCC MYA-4617 / FGSC 8958) TaxID=242507 RepID=G4N7W5_PYRO7|nr:uncharacterized protein MGG_06344 [Pyricularia oryzae 70-15]EHA50919.1 hypothetical protein MGG_06344 [Pyricularia oryzae 70-15]